MAEFEFEDILPFVEGEGDTGRTAREKINRNFDKIKPLGEIPAEVQLVSERVSVLSDRMDAANHAYKTQLLIDGYYDSSGNLNTQNHHAKNTGKISIDGYDRLEYSVSITNTAPGVAFFDATGNIISELSILGSSQGVIDLSAEEYANAKTVALSYYNANDDFSGFSGILFNEDSIEFLVQNIYKELAGNKTLRLSADGYYDSSGNLNVQNQHAKNTGKISIDGYDRLEYSVSITNTAPGVAFFDATGNIISELSILGSSQGVIDLSAEEYANAKTVALSYYNANDDFSGFSGQLCIMNTIGGRLEEVEKGVAELEEKVDNIQRPSISLNLTNGGYYNESGSVVYPTSTKAKNTGKVSIEGYDRLEYSVSIANTAPGVAFFDATGNIISELSILGSSQGVIDLSAEEYANAKTVALSYYNTNEDFSGFEGKIYNSTSLENRVDENSAQLENIKDTLSNCTASLQRLTLSESGYFNTNGTITTSQYGKNTGLITINGYDILEYGLSISASGMMVAFFDPNKRFLSGISLAGVSSYIRGQIDLSQEPYANVKYVALSSYNSNSDFSRFYGTLYSSRSVDIKVEYISRLLPYKEEGLNILIFGDSITDCANITIDANDRTSEYSLKSMNNSYTNMSGEKIYYSMWPYLITTVLKCNDVRNYAKSGASYKWLSREAGNERQNVLYQIEIAMNDLSNPNGVFPTAGEYNPDIVIFALGTNDGVPNDTYESAMSKTVMDSGNNTFNIDATLANLDRTKFCEAVRIAYLTLKRKFPFALYICVLPIQRRDREQGPLNEQLRLMAERYSMVVVDGAAMAGIVRDFEAPKNSSGYSPGVYLSDGLHPNDRGQLLMTKMILNAIKNNYIPM